MRHLKEKKLDSKGFLFTDWQQPDPQLCLDQCGHPGPPAHGPGQVQEQGHLHPHPARDGGRLPGPGPGKERLWMGKSLRAVQLQNELSRYWQLLVWPEFRMNILDSWKLIPLNTETTGPCLWYNSRLLLSCSNNQIKVLSNQNSFLYFLHNFTEMLLITALMKYQLLIFKIFVFRNYASGES